LHVNDNLLTIEGERKNERRDEQTGWSERENANATFKNGVLEITVDAPRLAQPRGRRIEVK